MVQNTTRYVLTFPSRRTPVEVFVEVREYDDGDPAGTRHGKVKVRVSYTDLNFPLSERQNSVGYEYDFGLIGDELRLRVGDFKLPPALRQCGIGTFIWSAIYRGLQPSTSRRLWLTGLLSSVDASIEQTDTEGRILRDHQSGAWSAKTSSNIERRTRFWQRMLGEQGSRIDVDASGNGGFKGLFADPACHPSYRPSFDVRVVSS